MSVAGDDDNRRDGQPRTTADGNDGDFGLDQDEVEEPAATADGTGPQFFGSNPRATRLRTRLDRGLGGRPLTVYGVLAAGAAVLLILLAIIWITATGDSNSDRPNCLPIAPPDALTAVARDQVDRINITADRVKAEERGPILVGLDLLDETCRFLEVPNGQADALLVIGSVSFHNSASDQDVRVHYEYRDIPRDVLETPTPTPTLTPLPTGTSTVGPASPTALPPTATVTATATATPTPTVVTTGSPVISLDLGSPPATRQTATATGTVTVTTVP